MDHRDECSLADKTRQGKQLTGFGNCRSTSIRLRDKFGTSSVGNRSSGAVKYMMRNAYRHMLISSRHVIDHKELMIAAVKLHVCGNCGDALNAQNVR